MLLRRRLFAPLFLVVLFVPACQTGKVELHPVKGRIMVGEKPVGHARVVFFPIGEPKLLEMNPSARTDANGYFELGCHKKGDGAPIGSYKVIVVWPKTLGRDDGSGEGEEGDRFEGRYANAEVTPLSAEVKKGKNELPPLLLN